MKSLDAFPRRTALTVAVAGLAACATRPSPGGGSSSLPDAVEALRVAMATGDGPALQSLLHDRLVYMHSSGNAQTKANVLSDLAGKAFFASLAYAAQTIDADGETGLATLLVDQVKNLPDGSTRASRIKVLQTWTAGGGGWTLYGRMSAIISSPIMGAQEPSAG